MYKTKWDINNTQKKYNIHHCNVKYEDMCNEVYLCKSLTSLMLFLLNTFSVKMKFKHLLLSCHSTSMVNKVVCWMFQLETVIIQSQCDAMSFVFEFIAYIDIIDGNLLITVWIMYSCWLFDDEWNAWHKWLIAVQVNVFAWTHC